MSEPPDYRKLYAPMVGVALAVIAADQITKHFATGLGISPAARRAMSKRLINGAA